jgi:hypothetical protein
VKGVEEELQVAATKLAGPILVSDAHGGQLFE